MNFSLLDLATLVPVLASAGVSSFKCANLEIVFRSTHVPKSELAPGAVAAEAEVPSPGVREPAAPPTTPAPAIPTHKVEDVVVPQSLDEEMDFDKLLFHSSPDDDSGAVALTNDRPLSDSTAGGSSVK